MLSSCRSVVGKRESIIALDGDFGRTENFCAQSDCIAAYGNAVDCPVCCGQALFKPGYSCKGRGCRLIVSSGLAVRRELESSRGFLLVSGGGTAYAPIRRLLNGRRNAVGERESIIAFDGDLGRAEDFIG